MKTLLRLCILLFLASSCTLFNKTKDANTTNNPGVELTNNSVDTSAIPTEFSTVDSSFHIDSVQISDVPPIPTEPLEFMTIEEWEMINEINLLRGDPNAYLRYVDEYIGQILTDPNWTSVERQEEIAAADELRMELQNMEPRNALLPYYKLHQVAIRHGEDMLKANEISHTGSNGSQPFERIQDSTDMDGTENLVGGHSTVREAIISLLIDGGISNRGNRSNLLNDRWQYIACFQVGAVAEVDNVWIQLFAFDDPTAIITKPAVLRSQPVDTTTIETEKAMEGDSIEITNPPEIPAKKDTVNIGKLNFLSSEEQAMINEINLMRSNPKGYIQYVNEYAENYRKNSFGPDTQFEEAVVELKALLNKMDPVSQLMPHEKLYEVAKAHGLDNQNHNQLEHEGSDKSNSFERVKRSGLKNHIDANGYFSLNENLVGGETTVRKTVIGLLIDTGIPTRGHRKTLINPNWEYVACYRIGLIKNLPELKNAEVKDMDHCWVQLFAKD